MHPAKYFLSSILKKKAFTLLGSKENVMFETLFFSPVVYIFSSVLRPNLVIFTSDLVVQ